MKKRILLWIVTLLAGTGYVLAQQSFEQARRLYESKKYKEAIAVLEKLAEEDDANAKFLLARCHYDGQGIQKDVAKAAQLYQESASLGHPLAMCQMGILHHEGIGVEQNDDEAVQWLLAAGESDAPQALELLGQWYPVREQKAQSILSRIRDRIDDWSGYFRQKHLAEVNLDGGLHEVVNDENYDLRGVICSASKVLAIDVSVNGEKNRGLRVVKDDGRASTIDRSLTLQEGENTISVKVRNGSGVQTVQKVIIYRKPVPVVEPVVVNPVPEPAPRTGEKRIALIMGNARYANKDLRLNNPVNDARDIAKKLKRLGFEVIEGCDLTREGMLDMIDNFSLKVNDYDVSFFYYAGHGIEQNGVNYMIPKDAKLETEGRIRNECVDMQGVLDVLPRDKMKIIILDACRNNPVSRSWHRGLDNQGTIREISVSSGTFIGYSTAKGDVALDGKKSDNSPFAKAFLEMLDEPNLDLDNFFNGVTEKVEKYTNEKQSPWKSGSIKGKFIFNRKD